MTRNEKVAIVTGANRGIGLEITRQLAAQGYLTVLTSRNEEKGRQALKELQKEELSVNYHALDVTSPASIERFKEKIEDEYGRCDVLVNNAGILPDASVASDEAPSVFKAHLDVMRGAMDTNVYGPLLMIQAFIPFMKKQNFGRIVNLSSGMGQLTYMNGGYPAYRLSKTSLNALTRIASEELLDFNIKVNCMCPGWVRTEMGGSGATRSIPEGAETAVWLSNLPDDGPSGKFFRDKQEFEW